MNVVTVNASRTYDICIERGLMKTCGALVREAAGGELAALITDSNTDRLFGNVVEQTLREAGYTVCRTSFPAGEASKNAETYLKLVTFCAQNGLTRSDVVVALGGGVVGDLAGFVASTYQRGIGLVQIPTTLLAMVDSSVGGKTAIDLPEGKNQVGTFYQPSLVVCDPNALQTLPPQIYADGLAEAVKYGVLSRPALFASLAAQTADIEDVIAECVGCKRDLVNADETDRGARALLNLGHTVGHAVEKLSNFAVSHGRGVAIGMAIITRAAEAQGDCLPGTAAAVENALLAQELPIRTDEPLDALVAAMMADKKRSGDQITLIVPQRIGQCALKKLPMSALADYLRPGL